MLNRKRLTKLLNDDFRKTILSSIRPDKMTNYKIFPYARYIVDSMIVHKEKQFENDKNAYYGFSPLSPLCAVKIDGTIDKKMFETKLVIHFLKEKDGDKAVEVIECILIEWTKEDKSIKDFDIDKIDAELAKIEKEYLEKKKKEAEEAESKAQKEQEELSANEQSKS